MERFFVHPEGVCGDYLYIRDSEAHHIKDVLRYHRGGKLSVFDGQGRIFEGEVAEIKIFSQALEELPSESISLIPYLGEKILTLDKLEWKKFRENVFILIGPEGDFTEEEIVQAKKKGVIPLSLGEHVLKSETAAIYLLSILNYQLR